MLEDLQFTRGQGWRAAARLGIRRGREGRARDLPGDALAEPGSALGHVVIF
jgi:hypothetical protein